MIDVQSDNSTQCFVSFTFAMNARDNDSGLWRRSLCGGRVRCDGFKLRPLGGGCS